MVDIVKQLSTGDFTLHFDDSKKDEFGELAGDLNVLVDSLQHMINEISLNAQQLATTADETSSISQRSFETINHQREQTEMIASAVEEMAVTVEEVARSTDSTLNEVDQAQTEVTHGEEVLQKNIKGLYHLRGADPWRYETLEKIMQIPYGEPVSGKVHEQLTQNRLQ